MVVQRTRREACGLLPFRVAMGFRLFLGVAGPALAEEFVAVGPAAPSLARLSIGEWIACGVAAVPQLRSESLKNFVPDTLSVAESPVSVS